MNLEDVTMKNTVTFGEGGDDPRGKLYVPADAIDHVYRDGDDGWVISASLLLEQDASGRVTSRPWDDAQRLN